MKELTRRDFLKGALAGTAASGLVCGTAIFHELIDEEHGVTYSETIKGTGALETDEPEEPTKPTEPEEPEEPTEPTEPEEEQDEEQEEGT